jgi:hypothetical protein
MMKLRDRLHVRLSSLLEGTPHGARVDALAEHFEAAIVDLVDRLRLGERRLRSAVLARVSLAERWVLMNPPGTEDVAIREAARLLFMEEMKRLTPAGPHQVWPPGVSQEEIADFIEHSGDPAGEPLVKALRDGWFYPQEGLIGVARAAYIKGSFEHPPALRIALDRYPLTECLLLLSIVREIRADAARKMIPVSSRKESRAAVAVISQGPRGPWAQSFIRTESLIELVWDGKPRQEQLALNLGPGFEVSVVKGVLKELREDGLRDYLCLHRMAAEQGRTGAITWTWREHRERTRYARRIEQNHVSEEAAAAAVTARLWRLARAEVRQSITRPDGARAWVRVGPFGLIDIPAGLDAPSKSLERARIVINPALYEGAHRDTIGQHFALLHEEVLSLDGPTLRLAALLGFDARFECDSGGSVVRKASTLWEYSNTRGGAPERRRWPAADEVLQRSLDNLVKVGAIGSWSREEGPASPEIRYEIHPTVTWRDQLVHGVPPQMPPSRAGLPRTGGEFKAWREVHGLTQVQAADQLGLGIATVRRAEANQSKELGPKFMRKLMGRGGEEK